MGKLARLAHHGHRLTVHQALRDEAAKEAGRTDDENAVAHRLTNGGRDRLENEGIRGNGNPVFNPN